MRAAHGPGPWDRVMMFVADAAVQEPPVLPFHRIQPAGSTAGAGRRVARSGRGRSRPCCDDDSSCTATAVRSRTASLVHRVAELPRHAARRLRAPRASPRTTSTSELRFTPDAVEADDAVRAGEAVAAFFLPPTTPDGSASVIDRGERLPQKSTFFWPKPRTGLVIRPLDLDASG